VHNPAMAGIMALCRHELYDRLTARLAQLGRRRVRTPYGTVHDGGDRLTADAWQSWEWAHRPRNRWPCSTLADRRVSAALDHGDLVDVRAPADIDGYELEAWIEDVLAHALEELAP